VSEVPLEHDAKRVELGSDRESIDLSGQVDFVTETVGRRDFDAERRHGTRPYTATTPRFSPTSVPIESVASKMRL
jgi:hypothetical protein